MTARHRILLVDDEPAVLTALQLAFADDAAFDVVAAPTAEAALVAAARQPFDLLVTDKNLPGDGGLALIRTLRARGHNMPVILVTGYANDASRDEARALERIAYVEKPFGNIYDIPRLAAEILRGSGAS